MKNSHQFAADYLFNVLGDRAGCDILGGLQDEIKEEIICELANLIDKRDKQISKAIEKIYG